MKNTFFKFFILAFLGASLISSCNKLEVRPDPTMSFSNDEGFTSKDTTLAAGDTVILGLKCIWNGTDQLKTLSLYLNNVYQNSYAVPTSRTDTVIWPIKILKSQYEEDTWIFELADENGQRAYLGILFTKDITGGAITSLNNITLGTQSNAGIGNFYALSNSTIYNLANATNNQTIVDLVCGYNSTDKAYLASPAANLSEYDLTSWTTKNQTLFNKTTKSALGFELIETDQLIVAAFDENLATDKITNLALNNVYAFKTAAGKHGILIINTLSASATGSVGVKIKIQQ